MKDFINDLREQIEILESKMFRADGSKLTSILPHEYEALDKIKKLLDNASKSAVVMD